MRPKYPPSLSLFPSLPLHGVPHAVDQLSGVYWSADEGQRARPQHHDGHEENTRHRPKFRSLSLHVRRLPFPARARLVLAPLTHSLTRARLPSPSRQGDKRVLRAVPDHRARGTLHHLHVPATHVCGVLPPAGAGPALRPAQPVDHHHDHRGHRWRHDAVGHRLQRRVPHQPGHGEQIPI